MAALPDKSPHFIEMVKEMNRTLARKDAEREAAWKGLNRSEVEACRVCYFPLRSYAWAWQDRPHCDGRCGERR